MSSNQVITVENLSKCYQIYEKPRDRLMQMLARGRHQYYREFWALQNVSFSIGRGETVGIIGRNGSGKSTLLQMICGTVSPTTGSITTNGRIAALLELGAGFNIEFTGRENVLLNAAILGFPQASMEERMGEVLAFSELGDFLDQPVKTYSSGMYARLAFSIAIHVDPEILIIDETLAVGDARFTAKCMRKIKDIQNRGTAILFVSHDVGSVRTLCQRAIWLDSGKLVEDGEVFPVTGRYMAFMFKDEPPEQGALQQDITANQYPSEPTSTSFSSEKSSDAAMEPPHTPDTSASDGTEAGPVTHWGSRKGIISSAYICDKHGKRQSVLKWGETVNVVIEARLPLDFSRENLSFAFSIKDLKGTDLIVSTTHDYQVIEIPATETTKITFSFVNSLVTGKYLLVAAVENRQYHDIHYYEYIEGVQYFASLSDQRFFGIFQPSVLQTIEPISS